MSERFTPAKCAGYDAAFALQGNSIRSIEDINEVDGKSGLSGLRREVRHWMNVSLQTRYTRIILFSGFTAGSSLSLPFGTKLFKKV